MLDDRAARSQVAAQHGHAAGLLERVVAALRMIVWFGTSSAASAISPMVWPLMVSASSARCARSSFISFGTPPAQWKCSM